MPVVQWNTVCTTLVLATKLGLTSVQADITAAFVHAPLDGPPVYMKQPKGFERIGPNGEELVQCLNKAVYGLKQSSRCFFNHLSELLVGYKLVQSDNDPCLFIGNLILVVVYIDDTLMFSKDDAVSEVGRLLEVKRHRHQTRRLCRRIPQCRCKCEMTDSGPQITLLQTGLTHRIISVLGLSSSLSTNCDTPAKVCALPKEKDGLEAKSNFSYPSVIGMLLYLTGHSRPDISFAFHQCARYTFKPTRKHDAALV